MDLELKKLPERAKRTLQRGIDNGTLYFDPETKEFNAVPLEEGEEVDEDKDDSDEDEENDSGPEKDK
jgi:hypothetical protein